MSQTHRPLVLRRAAIVAAFGEHLPMIGRLLGHSQVQTTARYAHLADNPVKAAAGKVSDDGGAAMMGGRKRLAAHHDSERGQEKK